MDKEMIDDKQTPSMAPGDPYKSLRDKVKDGTRSSKQKSPANFAHDL